MVNYRLVLVIISITIYECQTISGFLTDSLSLECFHQRIRLWTPETDVLSCQRDGSCLPAAPDVWCTPESAPGEERERERERERSGHCICHRVLMQLCVRLTDVRVSQKPCLWLKFHRLTASWLSLLLRRSPWANRQPNREKARLPCLRTTWNTEISHYTFSYANKNTHI